jgi:TRAP-type C4-dicarboxylate transport system substrate-binding protein
MIKGKEDKGMKRSAFMISLVSIGVALLFAVSSVAADLPKITWKVQFCCPESSPKFQKRVCLKPSPDSKPIGAGADLTKELSRVVAARTKGNFQLKCFAANELFGTTEAYEALEKGAIDMWFGPSWAFSGRNKFGYVSGSLPYSLENHDQAYHIMFETKFREIARRAYAKNNIYYICGSMGGADGITSTFPIRTMEDLKGKKIRGGGIKGKVNKALGAIDVVISPAEIYSALERGIIDGLMMPLYVMGERGYFEKCKYVSLPAVFGNWWVDWAANMNSWKKLPNEYQKILQEEADRLWKWTLKTNLPHLEKAVQEEWTKKGVQYITLSKENLKKFKKAVLPIWDEVAAMTPENAEVVKIYKDYLKD